MTGTRGEEIGVFSEKQRPTHSRDKKIKGASEAGYERVFICLSRWKFTIALLFLSCVSSHLPLHHPFPHFFFLITLSHEAPLLPQTPSWCVTVRDLDQHRYKHTLHKPTKNWLFCYGSTSFLPFCSSLLHPLFYHFFLSFFMFGFIALHHAFLFPCFLQLSGSLSSPQARH